MKRKLMAGLRHLRLKPFDDTTPEGRASERYRLAAWSALANAASTGIGMLALIITVPLTLPYLGQERFGVWMTIASLAGMLSFLDFGVGNSLVNQVAAARAGGDMGRLREIVSRGLLLLCGIGLLVGAPLAALSLWLGPQHLLKIQSSVTRAEAAEAFALFAFLFCIGIPLNGIPRIFAGLQQAWQAHAVRIVGSLVSVSAVVVLAHSQVGIATLLLATYGIQTLLPMVLLPLLWRRRLIGPSRSSQWAHTRQDLGAMAQVGGLFLVLQIGTMVGWGADALMVSSVLGASEAARLSIAQRLFQFVTLPLAILNTPLWAAYADARTRGEHGFVRRTLGRSLVTTLLLACSASLCIALAAPFLVRVWTKGAVTLPPGLIVAYALWAVLEAIGTAFAMFLNGMNIVRAQVLVVLLFCLVAVPLKIALLKLLGVQGIIWAGVTAYCACVVLPYALSFRRLLPTASDAPAAPSAIAPAAMAREPLLISDGILSPARPP